MISASSTLCSNSEFLKTWTALSGLKPVSRWQCSRGASKDKKERKNISVWPDGQWSKSEIRCDFRNIMCSAKCINLSWQDKVGSGLTLIYGVVLSILWLQGQGGDTGGPQTRCKFLLNWSEQTLLKPSLRHQAKNVESPFLFHTSRIQEVEASVPLRLCKCFHLFMSSSAPLWIQNCIWLGYVFLLGKFMFNVRVDFSWAFHKMRQYVLKKIFMQAACYLIGISFFHVRPLHIHTITFMAATGNLS